MIPVIAKRATFLLFLILSGCMHTVKEYYQGDNGKVFRSPDQKILEAREEQFVFLGFVFDTKYADKALQRLTDQCQNGWLHSISVKTTLDSGFFNLYWTNKILIRGYCAKTSEGKEVRSRSSDFDSRKLLTEGSEITHQFIQNSGMVVTRSMTQSK